MHHHSGKELFLKLLLPTEFTAAGTVTDSHRFPFYQHIENIPIPKSATKIIIFVKWGMFNVKSC